MLTRTHSAAALLAALLLAPALRAQAPAKRYRLDSADGLEPVGVRAERVTYRGRRAVHLTEAPLPPGAAPGGPTIAVLAGSDFTEGTIELDVAGAPAAGADSAARGFIGVAFHVQPDRARHRAFYLRPTNGRADDQLRRNHATQYIAMPDFPWHRLRREQPGVYESYVDLEPGVWTRMRIVVSGSRALLYVNGAPQPCLVVNDLKPGEGRGQIALWIGVGTDGYFSNLTVK